VTAKKVMDMTAGEAIANEMQAIVWEAGQPWRPGQNVKGAIARAARRLGISDRRAKTFWYRQPAAVLAQEADRLREVRALLDAEKLKRLDNERAVIRGRLEALESTHAEVAGRAARRSGGVAGEGEHDAGEASAAACRAVAATTAPLERPRAALNCNR
jgi:hypothetical protein